MANRILTADEAARLLLAVVQENAAKLPEHKRGEFYSAAASWLSGGVYR